MPDLETSGTRRTFRLVAATVAATLLALGLAAAGWRLSAPWRLGRVVLTNEGPPMTVRVLGASDDATILGPIELVRRATLELPPGDYRLHATGEAQLGRTLRFAVNRGETFEQSLTLDDNRLLGESTPQIQANSDPPRREAIPFAINTTAIELTPGRSDLVEFSFAPQRLRRLNGATGEPIWELPPRPKDGEPTKRPHPWLSWFLKYHSVLRKPIGPPTDLNGDGTRDLIWGEGPAFLAISGKDGSLLWTRLASVDGAGETDPEARGLPIANREGARWAYLLESPATADLDRDGAPDIVATLAFLETADEILARHPGRPREQMRTIQDRQYRRVVVAISGKTGHWIWSRPLDRGFVKIVGDWGQPAGVAIGRGGPIVGILVGPKWTGLDGATGRPRSDPIDLGFEPVRPLQYADLDGDGEPEILALGPGTTGSSQSLDAIAIATGRKLWGVTVGARYQNPVDEMSQPSWPLVADLDGDGHPEIAVPDAGMLDPKNSFRGVRLIDGSTGRDRWTRPMRPQTRGSDGLIGIVDAPDLDRDGVRDLVTTSFFLGRNPSKPNLHGPGETERLYVDALSGKDGHPLWWWHTDRPSDRFTYVGRPLWWGRGPDGWPFLAVPVDIENPRFSFQSDPPSSTDPAKVFILRASTGREVESIRHFRKVHADDLDGDGLNDLWGESHVQYRSDLRAFRGEAPEAWRSLGLFRPASSWSDEFRPAADLDGDGIGDVLMSIVRAPGPTPGQAQGTRIAMARSGADGRLLWKSDLGLRRGWFDPDIGESYTLEAFPMPEGDLDGDGTPEVLVREQAQEPPARVLRYPATFPLTVLSGRTGRPFWLAGPLPTGFEAHGYTLVHWAALKSVEPGAPADLFVRHDSPFRAASSSPPPWNAPRQERLARLSGRDGHVVWDVSLGDQPVPTGFAGSVSPPIFEDLDGDGALDLLLGTRSTSGAPGLGRDLKHVSLREGRLSWSQTFSVMNVTSSPGVKLFDVEGRDHPAVAVLTTASEGTGGRILAQGFDGRNGKPLWSWSQSTPSVWDGSLLGFRDVDGKRRIAIGYVGSLKKWRMVFPDAQGREGGHRDFVLDAQGGGLPQPIDLDGDGRDEWYVTRDGRYRALAADFTEKWSWPVSMGWNPTIIPASGGRPSLFLLASGLALDGRSGRPIWLAPRELGWSNTPSLPLDLGDATRRPLMIDNPTTLTVARSAMPVTPEGRPAPEVGDPVPPGSAAGDPRWTRSLPWTIPILHTIGPRRFLDFVALALLNVAAPFTFLWLAARRRPWTIRLLMAIPLAAALPLWVFQMVEPMIPPQIGGVPASPRLVFVAATLAGVPIAVLAAAVGWALIRRRWKALAGVISLAIALSAIVGAGWLWFDIRNMAAIEQYDWNEWPFAIVPGAYAAGILLLIGWLMFQSARGIRRFGRRRPNRTMDTVPAAPTM